MSIGQRVAGLLITAAVSVLLWWLAWRAGAVWVRRFSS